MFCCLRPANNEDSNVLATVAISQSSQGRGRIAPSSCMQTLDPSRGRGSSEKKARDLQQPYVADASMNLRPAAGSPTQTPAAAGASWGSTPRVLGASGGSNAASRPGGFLGWASGNGKAIPAEYQDTDPSDHLGGGKSLVMSLLSRGGSGGGSGSGSGSGSGFRRPGVSRTTSSRRRLRFGGGGGGDSDDEDNEGSPEDDLVVEPSEGGTVRRAHSNEAGRVHLRTQQPKRGILKKADTPLDAAASGDEEALLRIATALATNAATAVGTLVTASSGPAASSAVIASPFLSAVRPPSGALSPQDSLQQGDGLVYAQAASASLSPAQLSLDGLGTGGSRTSGSCHWMGEAAAATAGSITSGGVSTSVRFSGVIGTPVATVVTGVPMSRLANSNTGGWMAPDRSGPETTVVIPAAPAAGVAAGPETARVFSVRSVTLLASRGNSMARGGGGGRLSGPVVTFAEGDSAFGPVEPGGAVAASIVSGSLMATTTELITPSQPLLSQPSRLQLSERPLTPSSRTTPVVPASCTGEPSCSTPGGHGSRPRSPAAATATIVRPVSLSSGAVVQDLSVHGSRNGRGRRCPLTAARREEILRSLPSGKSPIWYAHKLREMLGTNEVEEESLFRCDSDGGGGGGAYGGSPLEDVDRGSAHCSVLGDYSVSRRFTTSRSLHAGDVASEAGPRLNVSTAPGEPHQFQRPSSRLTSTTQSMISVRHLAAAAGARAAASTGREEGFWASGSQVSLPGSMVLYHDGPDGSNDDAVNREPVRILRQTRSQRRLTYDTGDGSTSSAMVQGLLQRLAEGYASTGGLGTASTATAAAGSDTHVGATCGGDLLHRDHARVFGGTVLAGGGNHQSEPLSKSRGGKFQDGGGSGGNGLPGGGGSGAAAMAPSMLRPPSGPSRASGMCPGAAGGSVSGASRHFQGTFSPGTAAGGAGGPAIACAGGGGGGIGSAAGVAVTRSRVDLLPQAGDGEEETVSASPVWVLEEASKKLAGLLQEFGTDGVIYEGEEDED